MAASRQGGDGKYLKLKVLDFLDHRLAGGMKTWRQLAAEMPGYSSIDVDKLEADGSKLYQSSTKLLLRDWENRHGGCNVDLLKSYLEVMGRRDIIVDLQDKFEMNGIELVDSRPPQINTEQRCAYNNLQPVTQEGEDVVLVGKIYKGTIHGLQIIPHPQESKVPPKCDEVPQHLIPHTSPRDSYVSMEQKPVDSPIIERESHMMYSKRNSDPLQRREVSPSQRDQNHWGSGSMETFFTPGNDSPRNLKKTQSEIIDPKSTQEPNNRSSLSQTPPDGRKEEAIRGDFSSLHSRSPNNVHANIRDVPDHGGASPVSVTGKKYLLLTSKDEQDLKWGNKLCNILTKKKHNVYMLHDVPRETLPQVFYQVDFVLVIYTENYKKEFQEPGTANQELFQHMQMEHRNSNRNRFIPVYDIAVIRLLPDLLLHANPSERAYILDLLSNNKGSCNGSRMHSSAPSQGALGRVGGASRANSNDAHPIRRNDHTLSKSEPVIEREYHSPQNHAKPVHSEKKEKQPRFWFKNKKGK